jgi:ABC-2 type transport system permease protein
MLGFLNKFLALPAPRESMLYGKILFISVRGPATGNCDPADSHSAWSKDIESCKYNSDLSDSFSVFSVFSALSTMIGLYLNDHDSYGAVNSMISMPLFFTGSALMPYKVMPAWLRVMARLNPVSYAIDSTRMLFEGEYLFTGSWALQ